MYGAIQFALFPVKPSRAAHFTVIESPRTLLTPEKNTCIKKKGRAYIHVYTRATAVFYYNGGQLSRITPNKCDCAVGDREMLRLFQKADVVCECKISRVIRGEFYLQRPVRSSACLTKRCKS